MTNSCNCQTVSDDYSDHMHSCPVWVAGRADRLARKASKPPCMHRELCRDTDLAPIWYCPEPECNFEIAPEQLRGNLTLAEDGLASATQELRRVYELVTHWAGVAREKEAEIERLREVVTIPLLTPETTSSALFLRVLREYEKGQPVNTQDLINALSWRVRNQRKEIARLQAKRGSVEPNLPRCEHCGRLLDAAHASGCPIKSATSPHTTEDDFQHWLSYSGKRGQNEADLRLAYYAGADVGVPPKPSQDGQLEPTE